MTSRPDAGPPDHGVDLAPDAPAGVPADPAPGASPVPADLPPPGEGGVIAPGPTPESR